MEEDNGKSALRRKFSAARKALSAGERDRFDAAIRAQLAALPCFRQHEVVAAFVSFGAEPDLLPLLCGKTLLLPRFSKETQQYELVPAKDMKRDLLPGKYGILEVRPEIAAVSPDFAASRALFLVPAVSCDRKGTRLGRGGGYYDRLLAGVKTPPVAVIYSCQLSDSALPREAHDLPMGWVVTEREVIETKIN